MVNRSCGTCTKCCEGHLVGTINGKEMYPGKPCYLLQIGKGCSDYENRPEEPCKAFNCQWITNPQIPDDLYPATSGVIISIQQIGDIKFMKMNCAPNEPSADQLTWFILYGLKNQINIAWDTLQKKYWLGDSKFNKAMNDELGSS